MVREYTWGLNLGGGIGGLLNMKQAGQDYAYLYDGKGNVAAVLDASQTVVAAYRYAPFGKLLAKTGSLDQPFGFSTKRYDAQTGLIYYGFRFYEPEMSRWLTRDPLGEAGSMNLYAFVGNNPVNWVDPWGLQYAESAGTWGQLAREALLVIEAGAATALGTTVAVVTSPVVVATGVTVGIVFYATDAAGPTEIPMPVLPNAATEDGEECEIGGKKAIDSGKAEPHGDAGRALEKAQKRIEELEKQLEGASKKERKRIKKKIERILKDARQKKKGGTHWRR